MAKLAGRGQPSSALFSTQSLINHSSTRISNNCLRNSNTVIMYWQLG